MILNHCSGLCSCFFTFSVLVTVHLTVELNAGGRFPSTALAGSCLPTSPRAGPHQGSTVKSTPPPCSAAHVQSWSSSGLSAIGSQTGKKGENSNLSFICSGQPGSGAQASLCRAASCDHVLTGLPWQLRAECCLPRWPQQVASALLASGAERNKRCPSDSGASWA